MDREIDQGNPVTKAAGQAVDALTPKKPDLGGVTNVLGEAGGGEGADLALAALSRRPLSPDEVRKKAMKKYREGKRE